MPRKSSTAKKSSKKNASRPKLTRAQAAKSLDEAQFLIYDAWEAPTRRRAVTLARQALELSPDCADAYTLLAEVAAKTNEEALAFFREGVAAGERALGRKTFVEEVGYFWGLLETRPYMRARAGLAGLLWATGSRDEAVEHYQDLLRLNPGDNQGIRHTLLPRLIELDRDADAADLLERYEDDIMAVWPYSAALLELRRSGRSQRAAEALREAVQRNPHLPPYLCGKKSLPDVLPATYRIGHETEAAISAGLLQPAWSQTPGALEWLESSALADGEGAGATQ